MSSDTPRPSGTPAASSATARPLLRRPPLAAATAKPSPSRSAPASKPALNTPAARTGTAAATPASTGIRLNKRLAELGLCSRREADDWIAQGWVLVNGQVAAMGSKVSPQDRVEVERAAQRQQDSRVTILLNKPIGYVSGQAEDGHEPAVTLINPRTHWRQDSSGLRFTPPHLRGLAPAEIGRAHV